MELHSETTSNQRKGCSRRDFIKKSLGVAGLLGMVSTPIPLVMGLKQQNAAAGASPEHSQAGDGASEGSTRKARAWCMVIDLRKCEGCVTIGTPPGCTQACIDGHYVPKGQQWIQVYQAELPGGGSYFMPTPCFQCENAPCVNVCPVAATYHNGDGVVLIDHRRCIGCRFCMSACPYHRRFFNWGTPKLPPEAALAEYSPLYPVPAVKGTVIKCMLCAHMLRDGKLPLCVTGCPMKALYIGDLNEDLATNGAESVILSRFLKENNAYRFKEDLGTQPRVWYIPGHGEQLRRHADDEREMTPPVYRWGGAGADDPYGPWPWREPDNWTWEAQPK